MASLRTTALIDDVDGEPADETVAFGLDGVCYEIDLSQANADRLRGPLARYIGAARRSTPSPPAQQSRQHPAVGSTAAGPTPRQVREWAARQGITVSSRGRVSRTVTGLYRDVHR